MNYLEIAQKHNLNLIEVSILIQLEQRYPQAVAIEEITNDEKVYWKVRKNVNELIQKDFIEKEEQKYKIKRIF
ncbi:hypothetical protein [Oceanobacillus damuensis]|uniref:hypothetical protein n=1 Tax=Oceanobacillus damuensis TaxID=937928 RepID=UPI00082ED60C|nr:hypothetical protein [Oceanobacillus damuensis]